MQQENKWNNFQVYMNKSLKVSTLIFILNDGNYLN